MEELPLSLQKLCPKVFRELHQQRVALLSARLSDRPNSECLSSKYLLTIFASSSVFIDKHPVAEHCAVLCCAKLLHRDQLFRTLWTVTCQASLSMRFSRQEHWSGLPCPPPGDLPDPGMEPASLTSPALASVFFTTSTTREGQLSSEC